MIKVVNKYGRASEKEDYYIGRGSPLGNPYFFQNSNHPSANFKVSSREEAVYLYEHWLNNEILYGDPLICDAINHLIIKNLLGENVNLVCFCSPLLCHGEIIKKLVEEKTYCINWFSNMRRFDPTPLIYQGIKYWSVENFYQAMKLPKQDLDNRQLFARKNPGKAKRDIKDFPLPANWNEIKIDVMEYALRHKFKRNSKWGILLKAYSNKEIVEWNNWGDKFWGKCIYSQEGENHLGKLIQKIKNEL